jgi:hypothetical protein
VKPGAGGNSQPARKPVHKNDDPFFWCKINTHLTSKMQIWMTKTHFHSKQVPRATLHAI